MTYHDEFDDPEGGNPFGRIARALENGRTRLSARAPFLTVLMGLGALFILLAVFWVSYPRGDDPTRPVPMVQADADMASASYKTTPDDPGGMDIPYRDSTLFDTLRSANNAEDGASKVENLLPPPEEPMTREQMFAGLKTETLTPETGAPVTEMAEADVSSGEPVAKMVNDDLSAEPKPDPALEKEPAVEELEKTADEEPIKPAEDSKPAGMPTPVIAPEKKTDIRSAEKVEEKVAATEPAAGAAAPAVKAVQDGTHFVQMASVKDEAAARAEWKKMQAAFPAQLGNVELRVQKADLGAKGVFYRIQGGPLSQDQAKSICTAIAAKRPGGCIVVAR